MLLIVAFPACGGQSGPITTPAPVIDATVGATIDPCATSMYRSGPPWEAGVSFTLDVSTTWQTCIGGIAAGSSAKPLFRTLDGGHSWTLVSRTTFGATPEPGVGALPSGKGASALAFQDVSDGWVGLDSPGHNLYRTRDGGLSWTPAIDDLPSAVAVMTIVFTSANEGRVETSEGAWVTSDGGNDWTKSP